MRTKWTTTAAVVAATVGTAAAAWAGGAGAEGAPGGWVILFLAFGALVIALQTVPAVVLLASMLRTLFTRAREGAAAVETGREGA